MGRFRETVVNGGIFSRFIKRSLDVVSCGCVLAVPAIPMAVAAVKIKTEPEGPCHIWHRHAVSHKIR